MSLSPDDFMQLAVMEAKKALALNEVPVGAIVVKETKLLARVSTQSLEIILSQLMQRLMLSMQPVSSLTITD